MPTSQLYQTWIQRINELRPRQRITQIRNFVLLMYGIYQSRSVYLSRIVGKIPGKAKLQSVIKRLIVFSTIQLFGFANGTNRLRLNGSKNNLPALEKFA